MDVMQELGSHIVFTVCWVVATALREENGKIIALWVALAVAVVNASLWHCTKHQRIQIFISITATAVLLILAYQGFDNKAHITQTANHLSAWISVYFWFRILDIASVIRFLGVITKAGKDMLADICRFGVIFMIVYVSIISHL